VWQYSYAEGNQAQDWCCCCVQCCEFMTPERWKRESVVLEWSQPVMCISFCLSDHRLQMRIGKR
jgi:hypothetical protein